VCWSRKVLETMNLDKIRFIGYAFQIEMKFTAWKLGFKVVEVPIIFIDRTEGTSKMSSSIFKEAIFGVMSLRFKNVKKLHSSNK
jgi:dolichol-phosphate mannosyltransferase